MGSIRVISRSNIEADTAKAEGEAEKLELTPWDLQLLLVDPIQKGLLYNHKPTNDNLPNRNSLIQHLKASLSATLHLFPPLAGRLVVHDNNTTTTSSVSILCNNSGALFVHAVADDLSVGDILRPLYTPRIVHSFFPLNGVRNYQGTSQPLLAVQVTELLDGVFVGCTVNHVVADGTSFWHFFNSWSEISRDSGGLTISRPPLFQRWFLDGIIDCPVRIKKLQLDDHETRKVDVISHGQQEERVFHFSKHKVAELKAKANAMAAGAGDNNKKMNISSLQALLTHLWRTILRNQGMEGEEEVKYRLLIGMRGRMSDLSEDYFGNAVQEGSVSMKAGDLVVPEGFVKAAMEMNKMVGSFTEEKIMRNLKSWVKNPKLLTESEMAKNALVTSSSPRFDVYGNDFGWGKPVAVRSGAGNKTYGKITVFAGAEQGSIDVEVCLHSQLLEAMGKDSEFMDAVSLSPFHHSSLD